jgi:hypothetical protein
VFLRGPNGATEVVLRTEWDTETDAAEFEAAALQAIRTLGGDNGVLRDPGATFVLVMIGSLGDQVLPALEG